jgi:hypothetical protein
MAQKSTHAAHSRKTGPRAPAARLGTRPDQEAIRLRAYQIWHENGCLPGREVENWMQAERELGLSGRGY